MTIAIDKEKVFDEARKESSLVGKTAYNAAGESLYEAVLLTQQDRKLLARHFAEAISTLQTELREFLTEPVPVPAADDYGPCAVTLVLDREDPALEEGLRADAFHLCVAAVVWGWLSHTAPQEAERYAARFTDRLRDLRTKLYHKRPPKRPAHE